MIEVLYKDCLMLQDDIDELRLCMCINENTLLLVLFAIIFSLYTLSKKPQIPTKSILNPLIPLRAYIASDISRQFQNLNDIPVYTSRIETPKCVLNDQCSKILMAQISVYSLYIKIIVQ